MGMLNELVQRLQTQFAGTPEHLEHTGGVPSKPSIHAGCTPGTPGTPQNSKGGATIAEPPVPTPVPAPARTPERAANDASMADWHALDRAYLDHHMQCQECRTAGRRRGDRCATGAALWRAYEAAPVPWQQPEPQRRRAPSQEEQSLSSLHRAAMLACDYWGDSETQRQAMRQWCYAVPAAERGKWTHDFRTTYPMEAQQ